MLVPVADNVCAQGGGKIGYDEFVAVIVKSWERAVTAERLSEWLKQRYTRIEPTHIPKPGTAKYKKMMIPIFKPDEVSQPLRQSVDRVPTVLTSAAVHAKLYEEYLEANDAVEVGCGPGKCCCVHKEVPVESQGASLLNDHIKFCGLLDSLGEQSFARDNDMTIRESLLRKKQAYGARKFFTVNNKMLVGLAKEDGGSKRNLSLEPTRSKRRSSKKRSGAQQAAMPAATVRTIRPVSAHTAVDCLCHSLHDWAQANDDVEAGETGGL